MPIRRSCVMADGYEAEVTAADTASAFRWAAANGADILSNSWLFSDPLHIIHSAIVDVTQLGGMGRDGKGCVVVFSSGNSGGRMSSSSIAGYAEVISVGATDHDDVGWYYSSYGSELDIVAPGGGISDEDVLANMAKDYLWTTDITGIAGSSELHFVYGVYTDMLDYSAHGGTSSACPVAAGVAALILSVEPNLTNDEVRHFLTRSAKDLGDPGKDDYYGWGRVDARAALDMVLAKRADLNNDWKVDLKDFAMLAHFWKTSAAEGDIGPPPRLDGFVDVHDVILMGQYWMAEIPEPAQDR